LSHIFTKIARIELHTKYHLVLLLSFFLLFSAINVFAQDLPDSTLVSFPTVKDTSRVNINSFPLNARTRVADSTKQDSIIAQPDLISDIVDYFGKDYVYINRKENKVYMYNEAYIIYQDMRIDAGLIILDYNKNEVYAQGIVDTSGAYTQRPVFVQANNTVEPDSIIFNFDTQKALVYNSRTKEGEINVIAKIAKKENDSVVYMRDVKFTTSKDIDNPEYYFYARKIKFVPGKKIVTGLTNLYIADVPTPIGLPFAYFPLTKDRAAGFIIPTIGENANRGFFFQNGGYYIPISDYADLTILGDYYTNGSYGMRLESSYALRYRFRGNLSFRFEKLINGERGFSPFEPFSETSVYNLRWSHSQDSKANPSTRFSASVNLGSSRFFQESINQNNTASFLNNTLSSSVSYSKTFEGDPQININITATHQQNANTETINMTLPTFTGNVSRIYPFAPKTGIKKGIIQNINFQYDVQAQNRFQTTDSLFFTPQMFKDAQLGAQHTIPISTNFKIAKFLSASLSANYQETWVFKTIRRDFDPTLNEGDGAVVQDTVDGFEAFRTYGFSASLGTTLYGTFNFGETNKKGQPKLIQSIRHVVRPSIGYSNRPSFEQFYDEYVQNVAGTPDETEVIQYSRFETTLYGPPSLLSSSNVSFSVSNTIEAKIRDKDSTATEAKKISILNNLSFNTGYNFKADSLALSPISFRGSIPIVEKLDINFGGTLDPYALDNNNRKINTFNINNGGSLFRLTAFNVSANYSFSNRDFDGDNDEDNTDRNTNETFRNGGRPDDLFGNSNDFRGNQNDTNQDDEDDTDYEWYKYSIPWNLRLAYTLTYSNPGRQNEISSQSLMFSGDVEFSPRWSVGVSSGYDFKNDGFTYTQFRFQRDLESWQLSFNWVPFSTRSSWYFFVGIRSSVFSDIKYDKRREPDQRL